LGEIKFWLILVNSVERSAFHKLQLQGLAIQRIDRFIIEVSQA